MNEQRLALVGVIIVGVVALLMLRSSPIDARALLRRLRFRTPSAQPPETEAESPQLLSSESATLLETPVEEAPPSSSKRPSTLAERLPGQTGSRRRANLRASNAAAEQHEYRRLLLKAQGDHALAERLIDHEQRQAPQATRLECIRSANQSWERDNR